MIERLVEAVRAAGLRPVGIDLNAFALVRALVSGARDDAARVYCHLGAITNLAIAVGSSCLFTRPLTTRPDETGMIDAFALAEEIRLSIDFYLAQPETRPVREIVLSGPRAGVDGLTEQLAAATGLEVDGRRAARYVRPRGAPGRRGPAAPHRRARPRRWGRWREARQPSSRAVPAAHGRRRRLEDRLRRARRARAARAFAVFGYVIDGQQGETRATPRSPRRASRSRRPRRSP